MEDEPFVAAIDKHLIAELRFVVDQNIDLFVAFELLRPAVESAFRLLHPYETVGSLVVVDIYEVLFTFRKTPSLQGFGDEKVFGEPPVDKCAVGSGVYDLHDRKFAQHGQGSLRRCHDALFAVSVDKELLYAAEPHLFGHIPFRQQHLLLFGRGEDQPVVGLSHGF